MLDAVTGWLMFGAIATLKGTAVLGVGALAALALRRASSAARHLAWLLGLCGLLAIPVLMVALPGWQALSWPMLQAAPMPATAPAPPIETAPALSNSTGNPQAGERTSEQPEPPAPIVLPPALERRRSWLAPLIPLIPLAAWACGALLVTARAAFGLAQARRLGSRSLLVREGVVADQARLVARELGLKRYALRQAGQAKDSLVPMTWGWLVPTVLLPFEATGWSAARLRAVLLHEMGHVRRGDWAAQMLATAACAVFWFHPLAWLAARQLRIESESATDDCVLRAGVTPTSYSSDLLEIARLYGQRSHTIFSAFSTLIAIPMARPGMLEERLQAILDTKRPRRAIPRAVGLAAALLAATAVVPLATAQVKDAPQVLVERGGPSSRFVGPSPRTLRSSASSIVAPSPYHLRKVVFRQEKATLEREIGQRVSANTSLAQSRARWKELEQSMLMAGATSTEAKAVLSTAKNFLPTRSFGVPRSHWPVFVKRCSVNGKTHWFTVCVAAADDPKLATSVNGWNYWVSVVDPRKPKQLAANQVFPRLRDSL